LGQAAANPWLGAIPECIAENEVFAMQKLLLFSIAGVSLFVVSQCVILADDGGWMMPNLNPFSSTTKAPTSSRAAQPPTSGFKMPNLWPQSHAKAQPKRRANQPSTMSRMTSGAQNMFSKTADSLNPWDKKPAAQPQKLTGSKSVFTGKSTTTKAKKDTDVKPASWFGEKTDSRDKSVNDFLSRPRP
jgi:hypothetical protein